MNSGNRYTTRLTCILRNSQFMDLLQNIVAQRINFWYNRVRSVSDVPTYRFWVRHNDGNALNKLLIAIQDVGALALVC